jgi:Zn-dependent protease
VEVSPFHGGETNVSVPIASMLGLAVKLNVLLAVFNLIPIPPLDGGNMLAGLLPLDLARVFDRLRPFGILILYVLMFTHGFEYLVYPAQNFILGWLP